MTEPSPESTESDALIGAVVAGRYRVEKLLGAGGMGAVYRAEHVHMKKTVALKVLHKEFIGVNEIVARFEREAIAAARIEHPNVAPARDFGKLDDGSFYLVLEYVDGKSLRELIAEGPLDAQRAVAIAKQIALALVAAHGAGIVHRDLKPDNVMLVPQADGSERVKVLDFGIARVTLSPEVEKAATNLTKVGSVMGTVAYMAPEQALGEEVDERADLYALGVIVHEMLSGRVPFDADSAAQILAKQITEAPPPLPPGAPAALGALVSELLGKTRVERPPSARAVLERLEGFSSPRAPAATALAAPAVDASDDQKRRRVLVVGIGAGAALVGIALAVMLSGGGEPEAKPEALASAEPRPRASAPAASRPLARDAEPKAEPAPAGEPTGTTKPSASPAATSGKPSSKRKKEPATDSTKKRTGPGGIYIPPPDQWFK
ncbi:MAG TPA: protein kinase [Polyangiaceae bacterium]